jgi:osmotically inducible protein OsmC
VVWEKDLVHGSGRVKVASGALPEFPVSWSSRSEEDPNGKTSPEELLAAAQASCFAMALSAALARNKTPPERLDVSASCTFDKVGEGYKVTAMEISVRGRVSGIDETKFKELAKNAASTCPISSALKGNVQISETAMLE